MPVEPDKLKKLLPEDAETAEKFLVGKQQVECEGRKNLDHDRVFRGAHKALDSQVLLDFLEEQLDLTAFFIDVGDGFAQCRK